MIRKYTLFHWWEVKGTISKVPTIMRTEWQTYPHQCYGKYATVVIFRLNRYSAITWLDPDMCEIYAEVARLWKPHFRTVRQQSCCEHYEHEVFSVFKKYYRKRYLIIIDENKMQISGRWLQNPTSPHSGVYLEGYGIEQWRDLCNPQKTAIPCLRLVFLHVPGSLLLLVPPGLPRQARFRARGDGVHQGGGFTLAHR